MPVTWADDDEDEMERRAVERGRESLARGSQSITRAHQIAIDTDNVGVEVMNDLSEQRESLLRSMNRLQNIDEGVSKSRRLIKNLGRYFFYNKILLVLIIVMEVGILIGLLYIKFFTRK